MGKTIFITGASSGIGRATAELFAERGWHVLATMRNPEKAGALATMPGVEIIELDVTDSAGIDRVCANVLERHDVDVLFNNAGYGLMAPLEKPTEAQIRQLFDTDVMGTILVTQRFIGHFKSRRAGHVLTTTSLAAIIAFPRDAIYGAAKRAQQGMMESLYYELKPFGVSVKCIIPGGTNTGFQTPLNDAAGYEEANRRQRLFLLDGNDAFPGPEQAAQTVWEAVHDGKDQMNYPSDSVCSKLYAAYQKVGLEQFKIDFYSYLFD